MANPLYESMNKQNPFGMSKDTLLQNLNQLKSKMNCDPNQKIQELLNNGQYTQEQYNQAVQKAQCVSQFFNL